MIVNRNNSSSHTYILPQVIIHILHQMSLVVLLFSASSELKIYEQCTYIIQARLPQLLYEHLGFVS